MLSDMRLHRLILGSLILAGCLVLPGRGLDPGAMREAHAQSTGGSMGGGSFGSGGGYSGGSSSSYGSSSYGSSGGYGYSGGSYSSSGEGCGSPGFTLVMVVFFVLFIVVNMKKRAGASGLGQAPAHAIDMTVLRVAVDWRERKFVQAELDRIARSADTSNTAGLVRMLREVTVVLRRIRETWLYAGFVNAKPMLAPAAETLFQQYAQDARTRFREELIRNAEGAQATRQASAIDARSDEGEGIVVITLIAAARGHLLDFNDAADAEQVRRCLESLGNLTSAALVAVEIVWSPAAEDDRLSSAEFEVLYPDMKKIRGSSLAGRIHCTYCGGPFPAELLSCPHCGGRVPEQTAS